ncbi:MAG: GHMP kinase [bacterium]
MLIRAKAPLRISFAGGGTDVPPFSENEGGLVINATINKYAYGTLQPMKNRRIKIESVDFGVSMDYDIDQRLIYDGKLDLVKAAIHKMKGFKSKGFSLFLHSDVPPGSGLGSSSAMMVALVGLLKEFRGMPLTDYEIANIAYEIERKELAIKGGLQDQYAATFGGFNFIEFYKDRVIVNPLRVSKDTINELEHNLLLCYTGKTRFSDNIIIDQIRRYKSKDQDALLGLQKQKEFAVEMKNALLQRNLNDFGALLHQAWKFKKKMSNKISNPFIDEIYNMARDYGALGGKITGAGGGGYLLFYCRPQLKHKVAQALSKRGILITDFTFESDGLQTWRINHDE